MKYSNPAGIIAGSVVLEVIAVVCVALRLYIRFWKHERILVSDWLIMVALILATGLTVTEIYGVAVEVLAHPLSATLFSEKDAAGKLDTLKNLQNAIFLLSIVALGFIKTSVSFLYWHLFAKVKFRRFLIFWIVLMVAWTLSFTLCTLLQCRGHMNPPNPREYKQYCRACKDSGYVYVGSGIASDLITLLIPIPIVISMRLPTTQKLLVLGTFMIGALSVGASIAKGYMYIFSMQTSHKQDASMLLTEFSIWNLAEVQIGIIAACGMTLRPVLARIIPFQRISALFSSLRRTKHDPKDPTLPSFVRVREQEEVDRERKQTNRVSVGYGV